MSETSKDAVARLTPLVYAELKKLAGHFMRGERPDHTLQPTALVHEAYLRMSRGNSIEWAGETQFKKVAAQQMWRILVDHARRKRGPAQGGHLHRVTLDENVGLTEGRTIDVLALDAALDRLATALKVSPRTVVDDWRLATAWLRRELAHTDEGA